MDPRSALRFAVPLLIALLAPSTALAGGRDAKGKGPAPKGHATIVCHPSCDDIVLGRRSLGASATKVELEPGTHKVTLKRSGMPDKQIDVVVKAGEVASVRVDMAPQVSPPKEIAAKIAQKIKGAEGWFTLVCTPGCDDVILDGKRSLGKGPYMSVPVPEGAHEITLKRAGVPEKKMRVPVIAGQTTAFKISMDGVMLADKGAAPPPNARRIPKDEADMRARLEPKVWGGNASVQEIKLLTSLCGQHGDFACRERAEAMHAKVGGGKR